MRVTVIDCNVRKNPRGRRRINQNYRFFLSSEYNQFTDQQIANSISYLTRGKAIPSVNTKVKIRR